MATASRSHSFQRGGRLQAAVLLEVAPATISHWRPGRREPDSAKTLKRLGDFFGVDPFELLTTPFVQLLSVVGDPGRYAWTEEKIRGALIPYDDLEAAMLRDIEETLDRKRGSFRSAEERKLGAVPDPSE